MTIDPNNPLQLGQIGQKTFADPDSPGGIATDETSLSPGKYLLGLVLNRILKLLTETIQTLQSVAVQQANRLTFLTQWQKAYTDQMNGVHTFTVSNGDAYVSIKDDEHSTLRQSLNQINSTHIEQMRSNNNIIADTAKGLQTNINQTQDAVNQQSNMATSLIQQMNSILSSIYR
ncbi:MAG: hypothetical protein ACXV2C_00820 [Candidatus Bathyarchaeia archaeon]